MSTRRVALCSPADLAYSRAAIRGITQFATGHSSWYCALYSIGEFDLSRMGGEHWDGLLLESRGIPDLAATVARLGLPMVEFTGHRIDHMAFQVLPDDRMVGRLAAEHFALRGFRQFACCGFGPLFDYGWATDREEGFLTAAAEIGAVHPTFRDNTKNWGDLFGPAEKRRLRNWIVALPKPVAIFGCTDVRALHVLRLCAEAEVAVPDQVAIVGANNEDWICDAVRPTLSSVPLDARGAGYKAAAVLDALMSGESPDAPVTLVPPLPLVARESSDMYACADTDVASALRFIGKNAAKLITVDDVVAPGFLSRRALELRFKKTMGRTLQQEIDRVHIERAMALLGTGDRPMPEVAAMSGFSGAPQLSVTFRRVLGITPTEYRHHSRQHRSL